MIRLNCHPPSPTQAHPSPYTIIGNTDNGWACVRIPLNLVTERVRIRHTRWLPLAVMVLRRHPGGLYVVRIDNSANYLTLPDPDDLYIINPDALIEL